MTAKQVKVNLFAIFYPIATALIIFLFSVYFGTFVTHAEFSDYKISDQKTNVMLETKLEILIKSVDAIKKKLDVI
jgi:hypothetical protein